MPPPRSPRTKNGFMSSRTPPERTSSRQRSKQPVEQVRRTTTVRWAESMRRWGWLLVFVVAGLALIAGLLVYNRRTNDDINSQLWIPKPVTITPAIALLQQYVRIDTSNPPGKELAGARFL